MTSYVARVVGRRKGVHRLVDDPKASGSCNVGAFSDAYLTAEEFGRIAFDDPRRLCAHCFPSVDRPVRLP